MTTRRRSSALAFLALAALTTTGCAFSSGASDSSGGGFAPGAADGRYVESVDELSASDSEDAGGESADGDLSGFNTTSSDPRSVVTTGSLYLTVEVPRESAADAARITEAAGGRVDGRTEYAPTDRGGATDEGGAELVLRIPADRLSDTLDELQQLGTVEELSLSASDVTREVQDVEARISALRASLDRLEGLVADSETIEDLITLESAISDRQAQLESLDAQQRSLSDQVSLSTIRLTLGSERTAPPREPDTFVTGLTTGWDALVGFVSGMLVLAGVLLPWLLVLGVIGLLVWVLVRRTSRRRRAQGVSDAQPNEPAPPLAE